MAETSKNMPVKQESGFRKTLRFIRPVVISAAVVLLAFFIMQGLPLARTLYRRTDLVSALVMQNGKQVLLTEKDDIVRAAEVPGMLARRFGTKAEGEPDTCYVFTFEDGSELTVGVLGDDILYGGKWYTGAASTPELFRELTRVRFFEEPEDSE